MGSVVKMMLFSAALFSLVLLSSGTVYALGGGGSHGDGRSEYVQGGLSGAPSSSPQAAPDGDGGSTPVRIMGFAVPVAVPEPLGLFLLGFGVVGLAGVRRKLYKA